jgi:hypothetical protein
MALVIAAGAVLVTCGALRIACSISATPSSTKLIWESRYRKKVSRKQQVSCDSADSRSRLLVVDGFDSTLRYGGEDVDLGFRFTDAGFRIATSTAPVAEHTNETWAKWSQNIPRLVNYGRADYYLLVRHPTRTCADVPCQLIAIASGIAVGAITAIAYGIWVVPRLIALLFAATVAHHAVYAGLKSKSRSSYRGHFAGPVVASLLDFGKVVEAIKHGNPGAILRRVKYMDDMVARDWQEIAAGTWGVYASLLVFLIGIVLLSRTPL